MTPPHQQLHDLGDEPRRRRRFGAFGRAALSLAAIGAIGAAGVLTTQATFTDEVTMAQITVTGGSLDLKANGGDGPNQAWVGTLSAPLTGLKPGDEQSGTVEIENAGDLPFTITADAGGTDASGCYSFFFRETDVVTGTGAAAHPVTIAGMGTAAGDDSTTAAFTATVTGEDLADDGADLEWEADDEKEYTLTIRMDSDCTTNAAAGTFDMTFNATQTA